MVVVVGAVVEVVEDDVVEGSVTGTSVVDVDDDEVLEVELVDEGELVDDVDCTSSGFSTLPG